MSTSQIFLGAGRLQDVFGDAPALLDFVNVSFGSSMAIETTKAFILELPGSLHDLRKIFVNLQRTSETQKSLLGPSLRYPFIHSKISLGVPYIGRQKDGGD